MDGDQAAILMMLHILMECKHIRCRSEAGAINKPIRWSSIFDDTVLDHQILKRQGIKMPSDHIPEGKGGYQAASIERPGGVNDAKVVIAEKGGWNIEIHLVNRFRPVDRLRRMQIGDDPGAAAPCDGWSQCATLQNSDSGHYLQVWPRPTT